MKLILAAALALAAAACPARAALVVSNGATSNVSCASGVCTATAANAVLNEKDFRHMIGAGDLTLVSGSTAQDIVVNAKIQWAKAHHLSLDSFRGIAFTLELASEGGGGATLTTNDGGSGGTLSFTAKGKLTFWDTSSGLVINGTSYTLANDIATLAADIAANPSGAFALGRGYDASVDGAYKSAPIPTTLGGAFEGLGHAIDKLTMLHKRRLPGTDMGLFAAIGAMGSVRDLYLTGPDIEYADKAFGEHNTGAFAANSAGTIANVALIGGKVIGQCTGGIVGENDGTLANVSVSGGAVVGGGNEDSAGGLACINAGTITRSVFDGDVGPGSTGDAGGIAVANGGTISFSYVAGRVVVGSATTGNMPDQAAGGIATGNSGTISQSYSIASVEAGDCYAGEVHSNNAYSGGLVADNSGTIADSYATGTSYAGNSRGCGAVSGGLIADNATGAIVERVYSIGQVTCFSCSSDEWGGLMGIDAQMSNQSAYWDLNTSGVSDPSRGAGRPANDPGVTGLTTAQFQSGLPSGFDPSVWAQSASINGGYPYLIANPPQ